jgi:hypothetical protein
MHIIKLKRQNILLLSDTHGLHRLLDIPGEIDIVIHCGDVCDAGDMQQLLDFFVWYARLPIPYKVFVHGNHDLPFELEPLRSKKLVTRRNPLAKRYFGWDQWHPDYGHQRFSFLSSHGIRGAD